MHRIRQGTPESPHPEAVENRRQGAQVLYGVRERYAIERIPLDRGDRYEQDVLIGSGRICRWYAPFVHHEIPGELAKLRAADPSVVVDFAQSYGDLGFALLWQPDLAQIHERMERKEPLEFGDPLYWIDAHATGVSLCLAITHALGRKTRAATLRRLLSDFDQVGYGAAHRVTRLDVGDAERLYSTMLRRAPTADELARFIRRQIINSNILGIHRYVGTDETGKERTFFKFVAPINVVYWHLANIIDGGIVKKCAAEGCGGMFIQTDPRQRYCPRRWRQRESSCAMRQRQREARRA